MSKRLLVPPAVSFSNSILIHLHTGVQLAKRKHGVFLKATDPHVLDKAFKGVFGPASFVSPTR